MTPGHMRTCLLTVLLLALAFAGAVRGAETARQILDRRKALDDTTRHWNDRHQKMKLTIVDRRGDQWLYLPELQRVRQITARTRNESFVGTDLSYHDLDLIQELTSWTEDDARSSLRGEETVDGTPTYAIELVPRREDIGYKKIVVWLGRDDL